MAERYGHPRSCHFAVQWGTLQRKVCCAGRSGGARMKKWLKRIRGAIGMGLTWAVGGWLVGVAIEVIHNVWPNPLGSLVDIWPATLAYPAFLGGVVFSTVLAIAGRRHRFDELSLARFAAWGALGGLLASLFPAAMVALGLATQHPGVANHRCARRTLHARERDRSLRFACAGTNGRGPEAPRCQCRRGRRGAHRRRGAGAARWRSLKTL